jgi:hypothetical protein
MRAALKVVIVLGFAFAGFNAGGLFAVVAVINPDDGLTASATVLSFAFGVALLAGTAAVIMVRRLNEEKFAIATVASLASAGLAMMLVLWNNGRGFADGPSSGIMRVEAPASVMLPPPLPAPGTRDSLIGLVIVPDTAGYETREHEYEESGVTVYGRLRGFYLVGRKSGGRAWFPEGFAGAFHPTEKLVLDRLNYLTESWDRRLRSEPSPSAPPRTVRIAPGEHHDIPATVHEAKVTPDGIWIRVDVLGPGRCQGPDPRAIDSGWIPLWGADAKPTVWFYSRGC